jgi:geranylgeranyl diphosphate synthase type I
VSLGPFIIDATDRKTISVLSRYFDRLLPIIESDLQSVLTAPDGYPPLFFRMLRYHMGWASAEGMPDPAGGGGKRVRPLLCLLACESAGGDFNPARPAAAAVELIHNFSLLHDDVEDRSPTRRGRPTVWSVWGERQAINAGDALFALAHLAIPRLAQPGTLPADVLVDLLRTLDETCLELTRGQHLDMLFESQEAVSTNEYLDMIAGKTAALLGAAACMGALCAGASEARQTLYCTFGTRLGMAFQVRDDILDIWGDPSATGKEAAIDIRQRKKSLPVIYALARSEALRDLYADPDPFDDKAVAHAIALLDEVDARGYAEELARRYSEETVAALGEAAPQGDAGRALFDLVDRLLYRDR